MNNIKFTFTMAACLLMLVCGNTAISGQNRANAPKQEKLLNGMRLHFWPDKTANKAEIKLRIHSGAAFDTQDNEGQTCLTAEAIFPNEAAREFFIEDLDGGFEIVCNYDYVQINVSSRPDAFLTMLETLAAAVTQPTLDKETADAVKPMLTAKAEAASKTAAYAADQAAAQLLFGTFPYGRPINGTPESIEKVDFADLRFSYGRSFGADNATMAVIGNFDQDLAYRATRRFFGAWLKSDRKIPPTFRQPDAPDPKLKLIESPEDGVGEIRVAVRGTARNSADNPAFDILAAVLNARLKAKAPYDKKELAFVRHNAHVLPGMMIFGISGLNTGVKTGSDGNAGKSGDPFAEIMREKITDAEFTAAKLAVISERSKIAPAILWLDVDTFKIASVKAEQDAYALVKLADVQKAADKAASSPMAKVMLLSEKKETDK